MSAEFTGIASVREQLAGSTINVVDYGGALILAFDVPDGKPRADVTQRIPVEAVGLDRDGMPIHFLLHVVEGFAREIEVFREDSAPIQQIPDSAALTLLP